MIPQSLTTFFFFFERIIAKNNHLQRTGLYPWEIYSPAMRVMKILISCVIPRVLILSPQKACFKFIQERLSPSQFLKFLLRHWFPHWWLSARNHWHWFILFVIISTFSVWRIKPGSLVFLTVILSSCELAIP